MSLVPSGERMHPTASDVVTFWEHVYRYRFACGWARGRRILDVASGEGYGSAALRAAGARHVMGMDIDETAAAHARERYGLAVTIGDATRMPFADGQFDLVVSFETIEHLSFPDRFLAECARVCASRGTVIVSTPNKDVYRDESGINPYHINEMPAATFVGLVRAQVPGRLRLFGQVASSAVDRALQRRTAWDERLKAGPLARAWRALEDRSHYCRRRWVEDQDRRNVVNLIAHDRDPWWSYGMNAFRVISCPEPDLPRCKYTLAVVERT